MNQAEATDRINKWIKKGDESAKLDLSDLGLTELVGVPKNVKFIDISQNKFKHLPKELENCVEIYCWDNELEIIPFLSKCKIIWCFNNKIKNVGNLPVCELFDGRNNSIKSLSLPNANVIFVEGNPIQSKINAPKCVLLHKDTQTQLLLA